MSTADATLPVVRAARCNHRASDEEVYETLRRITDPLTSSWQRLAKARRIAIKFNMMKPHTTRFAGRRQELVDDAVGRAVLRLLRERTSADLVVTDTYVYNPERQAPPDFSYMPLLDEFGVEFVDANRGPFSEYEVPGGGNMFSRYTLTSCIGEADEFVSVAKMKNHLFMGVTLCMKNLFGLPPTERPAGRLRQYFHHAIRLSYVLPDLAMITNPCLNIVDALVGQAGREWDGQGRITDALIAGDQTTATDACAATLMGHDPASDWPQPPFRRDRNHLLVAAERGYGTVDLDRIDFASEVQAPLAAFDSDEQDPPPIVTKVRGSACEQALFYRDHQPRLADRYRGEFVFLRGGEVVHHADAPRDWASHRELAGGDPGAAIFVKLADPEEHEGERFEVYEENRQLIGA